MAEHEAGRESSILKQIMDGRKTVEMRLNRGKFRDFKPGDQVHLREDMYEKNKIVASLPDKAVTEITEIRHYPTFKAAFEQDGYGEATPDANSIDEAVADCRRFYTPEEEAEFGVLAIHFKLVQVN